MSEVRRMHNIRIGGKAGFMMSDDVWSEVRGAILRALAKHEDELVMYDSWTLNPTYNEDGEQVIIHFATEDLRWCGWRLEDRVEAVAGAESIEICPGLFTDEADREKVAELCGMVARGEIEVEQ